MYAFEKGRFIVSMFSFTEQKYAFATKDKGLWLVCYHASRSKFKISPWLSRDAEIRSG